MMAVTPTARPKGNIKLWLKESDPTDRRFIRPVLQTAEKV